MKKVLLISRIERDGSMLSYFMPYQIKRGIGNIDNSLYNSPVAAWNEGTDQTVENIEGLYSFRYNDIDIDYKLFSSVSAVVNFESIIDSLSCKYDEVIVIQSMFFLNGFELPPKSGKFKTIFLNINEAFHATDDSILKFLTDNKIISAGAFAHTHPNLYYEPFLNPMYFYYFYGFDQLSYTPIENTKTNLIGLYHRKNYKVWRDDLLSTIKTIADNDVCVYNETELKPQFFTELMRIHISSAWEKNHWTTYTDYISSVCGFVFETLNYNAFGGPSKSTHRNYITEKTLKAILFSKLNIPFIMDMNPYDFLELHKLGFWFMNSLFFDFDKVNSNEELAENMYNSIIKSVEYVSELAGDWGLDDTHKYLVESYGDKMQNNFDQFMKYLEKPKNNDKLIEFILYGNRN